jgi:CubicO group peptidase (beta-lactamase class C family)
MIAAMGISVLGFALASALAAAPAPAVIWPGDSWAPASPEAEGVDPRPLAEAIDEVRRRRIPLHSLMIVRHGRVVLDADFYPYDGKAPHDVASVTKSVTSMLVGIAIDRGYLPSEDAPAFDLLNIGDPPQADPRKREVTVGNLLSMTSGLDCGSTGGVETAETELAKMRRGPDWIGFAAALPMRTSPGAQFAYCSPNNHLLSAIVTARTGKSLQAFADEALFGPLGIHEGLWPRDPAGLSHGWGDLHLRPEDMARLGYLYLRNGQWNGRQVVSERWVRSSTQSKILVRPGVGYGYGWWINLGRTPNIPEAEGRGGQRISLVPDKDVAVVFTAGGADTDEIAPYILWAIRSDTPLPPDPAADDALKTAIALANAPPAPAVARRPPAAARRVSGWTYRFDPNPIGLRTLRLGFSGARAASLVLTTQDEQWSGFVGLDGVYRFSTHSHQNLPMAVRGEWVDERTFHLEINLIENITDISMTLRYRGDRAAAEVSDLTGSFRPFSTQATRIGRGRK